MKYPNYEGRKKLGLSLPSWERGLKSRYKRRIQKIRLSLPSWERGLKFEKSTKYNVKGTSLPSWERGLKFISEKETENSNLVAPFVGAWIEIQKKKRTTQ